MSEKTIRPVLDRETAKLVHNRKHLGESYNDCIYRVFKELLDKEELR